MHSTSLAHNFCFGCPCEGPCSARFLPDAGLLHFPSSVKQLRKSSSAEEAGGAQYCFSHCSHLLLQVAVQLSQFLVLPSSHSSPASSWLLPHTAGLPPLPP